MATLTEIRNAVADAVTAFVPEVNGYARLPGSIVAPAVIVRPQSQDRVTMGRGYVTYTFDLVCAAAAADNLHGQDVLDDMLATDSPMSISAVFDQADPLGLADTDADVSGWSEYTVQEIAGFDYYTAAFRLVVHTKGT